MRYSLFIASAWLLLSSACSEAPGETDPDPDPVDDGVELAFDVPATGRAFVKLAAPEVVAIPDDGATSEGWDLAFSGYEIFTNSGLSGPADGGAFPLDLTDYESGEVPAIPFLIEDEAGGAFADWWAYNPAEHVIYSRFHVFGVQSAGRYWKVQLYGFYGEVQGAPVSGLYQLRYAEVTASGAGPATELMDVDATAGGNEAPETEPSTCLDLDSGALLPLTPADALASTDWHLCFRRAVVSVNGELGGPGDVRAADVHLAESESESLEEVMTRTPASEAARFEGVGYPELTDPVHAYRGDHIVTAFEGLWLEGGASPPAPRADIAWLVQDADGVTRYLVRFDHFEGATDATPGRIVMRVKNVK